MLALDSLYRESESLERGLPSLLPSFRLTKYSLKSLGRVLASMA